jgi:hypothetical protein
MVSINSRKGEVVEVEWTDSYGSTGWMSSDDILDMATCGEVIVKTVGYLFHKDAKFVTLVQSHAMHNDDGHNTMTIPRSFVTSAKTLSTGLRKVKVKK